MKLTNYQLLLLDTLISLNKIIEYIGNQEERYSVEKMITDLLDNNEIDFYWKDDLKEGAGQCYMGKEEWIKLLTAIRNDQTLMNLTISNVVDTHSDPDKEDTNFRAACFTNKGESEDGHDDETIIVFRGTHGAYSWNDNGEGACQLDTNSQREALDYVDMVGADLSTNGTITVTGHSKGGNLAQYVTIVICVIVQNRVYFYNFFLSILLRNVFLISCGL